MSTGGGVSRPETHRCDPGAETEGALGNDVVLESFEEMAKRRAQRPRRRGGNNATRYKLSESRQAYVDGQVKLALKKLDLKFSGVKSSLTGDRVLAKNTSDSYLSNLRQLRYFLSLIGDWESLIILGDNSPEFAPSIRVESLVLFLDWKVKKPGTVLFDANNETVYIAGPKPRRGRAQRAILKADGGWRNPDNTSAFGGALSALHNAKGMEGIVYSEACDRCLKKFHDSNQKDVSGCRYHAGRARLWRCGNPRLTETYGNRIKRLFTIDLSGYEPHGDSMLMPRELLNVRTYCLAKNDRKHWRIWTMILLSVKLFLRSDEAVPFNDTENFVRALTSLDDSGMVKHLAFKVKGKRDRNYVNLLSYFDNDVPEFDLVRQLLAWIWLSEYESGPLFPSDTDPSQPVNLKTYGNQVSAIVKRVTGRDGPFRTHFCRKTSWLLGSWGGAEDTDLRSASRHKSLAEAHRYKKDAMTLKEIAKKNG